MDRIYIIKGNSLITQPVPLTMITIFFMSEMISIVCLRDPLCGVWFALFQLVGILVPGMACLLAGGGWAKGFDWKACACSYVIGYCLSLFGYFAIMLFNLQLYVKHIVFLAFIISCSVIFLKKRNLELVTDNNSFAQRLILVSIWIMFGVAFIASCCNYLLPPVVQECSPENDMLYWVGNIIELAQEFPPKDFRNYPSIFSYHYFSSAQLALASLFTGIRPVHMGLFFSVVQSVLLRVFGGYLVLTKCTKSFYLQAVGMVLLFFASGFETTVLLTYLAHSYHAPFGMEYGLAIYLVFLYLLIVKYAEKTNQIRTCVLIWACVFVLVGEKVSYGGIGLLGLGVLCIGFLLKKEYTKAIITGVPACSIFIIVYFSVINLTRFINNPASRAGGNSFVPIWTHVGTNIAQFVYTITGNIPLFSSFVLVVAFIFLGNPACFWATVYNCYRITKCKCWNIFDVALLSMYVAGFFTWIFVQMYGLSNMYFAFASFPVAIIWLVKCKLPWSKTGTIALAMTAVLSIVGFVNGYKEHRSLFDYCSYGFSLVSSGKLHPKAIAARTYVDMEQYEAYEWIRANSEQDNIIATNRVSLSVGVFTERYINHSKMKNSVYAKATDKERAEALSEYKKLGVKYIMFEAKYGAPVEYLAKACDTVYQTDNIKIYAVPQT